MSVLPDPVVFIWDQGNKDKNYKKHKVTNQEAEEGCKNTPFLISEDHKHSSYEQRFQALGKTDRSRLLFLSFTIRGDRIRIISARDMSKKERSIYEKI